MLNCLTAGNECVTSEQHARSPKQLAGQECECTLFGCVKVKASIKRPKSKRERALWSGNKAERSTQETRREGARLPDFCLSDGEGFYTIQRH